MLLPVDRTRRFPHPHLLGLGWPALILALGGTGLAAMNAAPGPDRGRWLVLGLFPVLYFLLLARQGGLIFGRYLLPILPPACVLAACACCWLGRVARVASLSHGRRTAAAAVLALVVVVPPASQSISWLRGLGEGTTAQLVVQWLVRNVPPGSRVVHEKGGGMQLPATRFRVSYTHSLVIRSYEDYLAAGDRYLIASSDAFGPVLAAPQKNPEQARGYEHLFLRCETLVVVQPTRGYPGPTFRVLELR